MTRTHTTSAAETPLAARLWDVLFPEEGREKWWNTPALVDAHEQLTYGQFHDEVLTVAAGIIDRLDQMHGQAEPTGSHNSLGGTVVGIELPNGCGFAIAFHAVLAAGCIAMPVPQVPDTSYFYARSGAALALNEEELARLRQHPRRLEHSYPRSGTDVAALPFSSGTTSLPKPVRLSHANLAANVAQFAAVAPWQPGTTVLSVLPLSHIYGLTVLLNVPLAMKCRVVTKPFSPKEFLDDHARFRPAVSFIAPPLARLLATAKADFSSLTVVISGAAPLDPTIAKQAETNTGAKIYQGYGLTEASPVTHLCRHDDPLASIGHPLPHTTHSILDPHDGTPLPNGQTGELWVQGPQIMLGYEGEADTGDWLRTGDLASIGGDGEVYIHGRVKELIKYNGFSINPYRVEQAITAAGLCDDCAVYPATSSSGEEIPAAALVSPKPANLTLEQLQRALEPHLGRYELPRALRIVDAIPRSAAGKTLRREL